MKKKGKISLTSLENRVFKFVNPEYFEEFSQTHKKNLNLYEPMICALRPKVNQHKKLFEIKKKISTSNIETKCNENIFGGSKLFKAIKDSKNALLLPDKRLH